VVIVVDSVGDEEEEISTSEYRTPLIHCSHTLFFAQCRPYLPHPSIHPSIHPKPRFFEPGDFLAIVFDSLSAVAYLLGAGLSVEFSTLDSLQENY